MFEWHNNPDYVEGGFFTDQRFWDCECEEYYIHARAIDIKCPFCRAEESYMPDSRAMEIARGGLFAEAHSMLIAYNDGVYYDTMDLYFNKALRRKYPSLSDYEIAVMNQEIREKMEET